MPATTPARTMLAAVEKHLMEAYGPPPLRLPDGIRLEMHPSVEFALRRDEDLYRYTAPGTDPVQEMMPVPVKVTIDMPADAWRLVIITEDVLLEGTT